MNSYFTISLYVVEGSEKMLIFCTVAIFRETFKIEWLRKDVFIFNLTGVYAIVLTSLCLPKQKINRHPKNIFLFVL